MSIPERPPTTVLRIITRLNIGGPGRHALNLTRELRATHPTILAAGSPGADEGELADPEVPVHRVPLTRPIRPHRDFYSFAQLRSLMRDRSPLIVHTHMAKAGALGRLAARTAGTPIRTVHTFHGHVLSGYFSEPLTRIAVAAERRLARHTDVLVAVSPEIRDQLLDMGIGSPRQYRVVRVGLDLSDLLSVPDLGAPADGPKLSPLRARIGVGPDTPIVAVVGRLVPIKNHSMVLRMARLIGEAHVVIAGDGECRGQLVEESMHAGVGDRVHFIGWQDDMAELLDDASVVVLTSSNEGTPVSLIEAMAAGRPVVATDVGGVRHVVVDGSTGFLVKVDDDEGAAAAVRKLLSQPELSVELGRNGRIRAAEHFALPRLVSDIRDLYDELLNGSAGG